MELAGVEYYVEFALEIEFKEDCYWGGDSFIDGWNKTFETDKDAGFYQFKKFASLKGNG